MEIKGIDVSRWQGVIDWKAVKADGVKFAIIKAGGSDAGFYKDRTFEQNYAGAKANGIAVGAYYFVGKLCDSAADGAADAMRFLEIIKGKQFEYPVYIDFEAPDSTNKAGNTDAVIAFCEVMENAGYFVGVYASEISGFKDRLDDSRLQHISHWVARYGRKQPATNANVFHIWQYSSKGRVAGINGNVDMDTSYVDLETVIKNNYLNGFIKEEKLNNYQVAAKIIKGEWNIEDARAYKYDATQVQHIIDVYEKVRAEL